MSTLLIASHVLLWCLVLVVSLLLLGTLRSLGMLQWRFDELDATRPVRPGREGLAAGKPAPEFTLPDVTGDDVSLSDFANQRRLLVFTQSSCSPCRAVLPELKQLQASGKHHVLIVNSGKRRDASEMARKVGSGVPVLTQSDWEISKQYRVFATPFAFIIDERGVIAAKGLASTSQYIRFLLDAADNYCKQFSDSMDRSSKVENDSESSLNAKEILHAQ